MNAAHGWRKATGCIQRADCQPLGNCCAFTYGQRIPLHVITERPADDAAGVQIKDDGQIQPAFTGPDVAYITGPFWVRAIRSEVLIQQVGRDVERAIAIRRRRVFMGPDDLDVILAHQTAYAPVSDL